MPCHRSTSLLALTLVSLAVGCSREGQLVEASSEVPELRGNQALGLVDATLEGTMEVWQFSGSARLTPYSASERGLELEVLRDTSDPELTGSGSSAMEAITIHGDLTGPEFAPGARMRFYAGSGGEVDVGVLGCAGDDASSWDYDDYASAVDVEIDEEPAEAPDEPPFRVMRLRAEFPGSGNVARASFRYQVW
jgi:hypothetical protein